VAVLRLLGLDHNKWNVRDAFCHTTVYHHEKVFEIGIMVDDKTLNYLTSVGYSFLFKENDKQKGDR
jgi:hypothetical protein